MRYYRHPSRKQEAENAVILIGDRTDNNKLAQMQWNYSQTDTYSRAHYSNLAKQIASVICNDALPTMTQASLSRTTGRHYPEINLWSGR